MQKQLYIPTLNGMPFGIVFNAKAEAAANAITCNSAALWKMTLQYSRDIGTILLNHCDFEKSYTSELQSNHRITAILQNSSTIQIF